MGKQGVPIKNAERIAKVINSETDLKVRNIEVQTALKYELNYSYRRAKEVPVQSNTVRCLAMRQRYGL